MEKPNSPLYLTTLEVIAKILIRLWLVIGILMANNIDLYKGSNALLDSLIDISGDRSKMPEFMRLVRQIESGGKYRRFKGETDFPYGNGSARADSTTAAGVYQFTKDTVSRAKNRAKNLGIDSGFINLIPNDPTQWTDKEADVMFLANMFAAIVDPNNPKASKGQMYSGLQGRPGIIDSLLVEAFKPKNPSIDAMKDLYYTIHHTNPDAATKARAKKIFK